MNIFSDHDFNYFMHHADFRSIKKLKLSTENLSLPVLNKLMDLPNLQSIFLDEDRISRYQLADLPEKERAIKQQQCDERNYALLQLLFALQAQQNCEIRLDARSGLLFSYSKKEGEIFADVNQNDFNYLLKILPRDKITGLSLRQCQFPIPLLENLAQFTNLKRLCIEEGLSNKVNDNPVDNQTQNGAYQRREARNQALWTLLIHLQSKLHCDIKLISETLQEFEKRYQG